MSLNRASKKFLGCVAVVIGIPVLLLLYAVVWPPYYRQDTIRVRVVDSETKKPIPGLAVVAQWFTTSVPFGSGSLMRSAETTTSDDGVFEFPAWTQRRPLLAYLEDCDPQIWIYKYGYDSLQIDNRPAYVEVVDVGYGWEPRRPVRGDQIAEKYPGWRWGGIKRFFYWNHRTIGLKPTKTAEEEARALEGGELLVEGNTAPHYQKVWQDGLQSLPVTVLTREHLGLAMSRGIRPPPEDKPEN